MPLLYPCEILVSFKNKVFLICANIWIFAVFICWTLLFLPWGLAIVSLDTLRLWRDGPNFMRQACYFYARIMWYLLLPALPIRIHNEDGVKKHAPCIIIANHQSFLDLFLFGAQSSPNFCFFSKSWPYKKLFFFAPMMRYAEYINVEELPPEEVEKRSLALLKKGVSLVIFPEGQRTRTGALGRFHVGAFHLACLAHVPVVPLVIENSNAVFPIGGTYFTPEPIVVRVLSAIYPQDFMYETFPHRAMMKKARECYLHYFQQRTDKVHKETKYA
jgi:1-acyl-sn-glycerol-3-phosphate acyltransferase